jgi:hypothetical protein
MSSTLSFDTGRAGLASRGGREGAHRFVFVRRPGSTSAAIPRPPLQPHGGRTSRIAPSAAATASTYAAASALDATDEPEYVRLPCHSTVVSCGCRARRRPP